MIHLGSVQVLRILIVILCLLRALPLCQLKGRTRSACDRRVHHWSIGDVIRKALHHVECLLLWEGLLIVELLLHLLKSNGQLRVIMMRSQAVEVEVG